MSRYWKAALPFLLAAVIILAAASRLLTPPLKSLRQSTPT